MPFDELLRAVLACPVDKGELLYVPDESVLYNPRLRLRYTIRDTVPVLLRDQAETVDDREHGRLVDAAGRAGHAVGGVEDGHRS